MEDSEINVIALERIIPEAIKGNQEALNLLFAHWWMNRLLDRLTRWALKKYDTERYPKANSVPGVIYEKLLREGHTIKNKDHKPWCACLEAWSRRVVRNYYLNVIRDWKAELKHVEQIPDIPIEEPRSPEMTPEEELLAKEEELLAEEEKRLWEDRGVELRRRLRKVIKTFPPNDARIMPLWAAGKNLREIAEQTKIPLSSVHRRETEILKALVEEIGAFMEEIAAKNNLEAGKPALEKGLMELVAHILQEVDKVAVMLRT